MPISWAARLMPPRGFSTLRMQTNCCFLINRAPQLCYLPSHESVSSLIPACAHTLSASELRSPHGALRGGVQSWGLEAFAQRWAASHQRPAVTQLCFPLQGTQDGGPGSRVAALPAREPGLFKSRWNSPDRTPRKPHAGMSPKDPIYCSLIRQLLTHK